MKCQDLFYLKNKNKIKMSSAADDSPEMSRLIFSEKKKIQVKFLFFWVFFFFFFFFFFAAAVVIGAVRINLNCTEGSARLYINP